MTILSHHGYQQALTDMRANTRSVWSSKNQEDLTDTFAAGRIHDGYADVMSPTPFKFSKNQNFFCVGSCFARELEDAIASEGYIAETRDRSLFMVERYPELFQAASNVIGRPSAFLNRYNSGSMDLLMVDIVKDTLGEQLLFPIRGGNVIDFHYTRFIQPVNQQAAMRRRQIIREMYQASLLKSDIFVFTLGLCESFFDLDDNSYLNITPDPRSAAGRNLEFRFLTVEDNIQYIQSLIKNLRTARPDAEVILTVSPVPLDLTFTKLDIIVANSLAKANLLAAAHAVSAEIEGCYYFPSYEIVQSSAQECAWLWDKKHVAPAMVQHVMKNFIQEHLTL